jgi:cysteine desulfurase/selenocysteine lyase
MSNIKNDFPIFQTHPALVYLDSTATSQKPRVVIDGVAEYLRTGYANIHRGSYKISEVSEKLYEDSKRIVAKHIGAESWREVIYTGNSTYALNLFSQSIWRTGLLKKWDTVLLSIVEHHANVVPWLILQEDYGINVEFVGIKEDFSLDLEDFETKLDDSVKVVSLTHVSNTTGEIFALEKVGKILDEWSQETQLEKPLFIVDASQSVPHFKVYVKKIRCDALFFTGHKVFADSGIGVLWAKEELLTMLRPIFSGGGAIGSVSQDGFTHSAKLPDKFEPGTPNLSGAVSILRAFEYIESIGGYKELEKIEEGLVKYALEKFTQVSEISLIWWTEAKSRVGVFTFYVEGIHSFDISDYLAEHNICIRAGQHCAEPAMQHFWVKHTCRMSLHIYNTREDIDRFFEVLETALTELS